MRLRIAICTLALCGVAFCLGQQQSAPPAPPTMESAPAPPPSTNSKNSKSSKKHKPHSVQLKWEESKTKGIEGYYVYRADGGPSGDFARITPKPIKKTEFKDLNVKAGKTYSYAVSAVQRLGGKEIESARTMPVTVQIPSP
ncbi:MAG: hypothetical protein ACRD3E_02465 [Terriglobales bacterium]